MKKIIKLTENDLKRIVKRVIKENDELLATPGKYYALGGYYFYVNNGKMYLADKDKGELKPNLMVEFPATKQISATWTKNTKEIDIPEIKGKELKGLEFDQLMRNAITYGKEVYRKNEAIVNFGSMIPIIFYSQKFEAPTLGGFIIGTNFPDVVEGRLTTLSDPKPGDKIYFQQSTFKAGKEYGISLEVSMHGQPVDVGTASNMLKLPKIYNVGDLFSENSADPMNLDKASFLDNIRSHIKNGGRINKITIDASTSKMPAGFINNDETKGNWKDMNDFSDSVVGNNDDGTGNLQLCRHKAMNTYNILKTAIPELASAPYVLKASGPIGEFVHIKFE